MRLTRAAQRAQQGNDETTETSDLDERAPLNEISPNASPDLGKHKDELPKKAPAKKTKGKSGAKKGAKGKKGKAIDEEEHEIVEIPASDAAVDSLPAGSSPGEQLYEYHKLSSRD